MSATPAHFHIPDQSDPSNSRAKPILSTPQKRLNHIMSEQKRRNAIRDGYVQLTALLAPAGAPPGTGMPTRGRPKGSGNRGKGRCQGKKWNSLPSSRVLSLDGRKCGLSRTRGVESRGCCWNTFHMSPYLLVSCIATSEELNSHNSQSLYHVPSYFRTIVTCNNLPV